MKKRAYRVNIFEPIGILVYGRGELGNLCNEPNLQPRQSRLAVGFDNNKPGNCFRFDSLSNTLSVR